MTESITDDQAAELGLEVLNTPGGLDELERQGIENLTTAVKSLSRDLARGIVPPEMKETAEYIVREGTAKLKDLGIELLGSAN
jgi:hypothetical protein